MCCLLQIKEIKYRQIHHNRFHVFNEGLKQKLKVKKKKKKPSFLEKCNCWLLSDTYLVN